MILFTKLVLAHLIGDFIAQPNHWVRDKETRKAASKYLYIHVLIHLVLTLVVLWDIRYWKIALLIALSHLLIDIVKLYVTPLFENKAIPFFADQLLHILVLYCCAYFGELQTHTLQLLAMIDWPLITALVFLSFPTAIIMGKLLLKMSDQLEMDHKSLPNAGKYIGMLERIFVLIFIVLDHWEAIGLLITAKSVFRFNDLKESNSRKLTEYILIGTLLSFGIAIITGIIYTSI